MVVSFPGSKFDGSVAPALAEVVARGDIAIDDLAIVTKADDGSILIVELEDLQSMDMGSFSSAAGDLLGLLNEEDLIAIGEALEPGSSAVAIVFEHLWARGLAAAVEGTAGQVIFSERIPRDVVHLAIAATN